MSALVIEVYRSVTTTDWQARVTRDGDVVFVTGWHPKEIDALTVAECFIEQYVK